MNRQYVQENIGCAHLLDQGWKVPRCVDACPTEAIRFGEEEELQEIIAGSEELSPEFGCAPRVHYLNLPKRFIAGAVYDPEADECLQGAVVTLTNLQDGESQTRTTDIYGDFWFEQIDIGNYSLRIELDGYLSRQIDAISTEEDVNVGDLALYREPVVA